MGIVVATKREPRWAAGVTVNEQRWIVPPNDKFQQFAERAARLKWAATGRKQDLKK